MRNEFNEGPMNWFLWLSKNPLSISMLIDTIFGWFNQIIERKK